MVGNRLLTIMAGKYTPLQLFADVITVHMGGNSIVVDSNYPVALGADC